MNYVYIVPHPDCFTTIVFERDMTINKYSFIFPFRFPQLCRTPITLRSCYLLSTKFGKYSCIKMCYLQ